MVSRDFDTEPAAHRDTRSPIGQSSETLMGKAEERNEKEAVSEIGLEVPHFRRIDSVNRTHVCERHIGDEAKPLTDKL